MRYPIYLHQADDGSFSGFVPDVIGGYFTGDTIDDAISNAQNALDGVRLDTHFEYMSEKGHVPNQAKTVADCTGGSWAYVYIDLTKYGSKPLPDTPEARRQRESESKINNAAFLCLVGKHDGTPCRCPSCSSNQLAACRRLRTVLLS